MHSSSHEEPIVERIPSAARLFTAPVPFVLLFAAAIAIGIFTACTATEFYLYRNGYPPLAIMGATNALAALLAGYTAFRLVMVARRRRAAIRTRLQLVADMNHRIRNVLGIIQLSAYSSQNVETIRQINDSVNRIDAALAGLVVVQRTQE